MSKNREERNKNNGKIIYVWYIIGRNRAVDENGAVVILK